MVCSGCGKDISETWNHQMGKSWYCLECFREIDLDTRVRSRDKLWEGHTYHDERHSDCPVCRRK